MPRTSARREPDSYGGFLEKPAFPTPMSKSLETLERSLGGGAGLLVDSEGRALSALPGRDEQRATFEATVADNPPAKMTVLTASGKRRKLTASAAVEAATTVLRAQVIPGDVVASYKMVDYYYATEGDVRQMVQVPAEVAIRPIQVDDPDPGVKAFTEQILGPDYLDVDSLIPDLWLSKALYGVAYPFEVWSGRVPDKYGLNEIVRGKDAGPAVYPQAVTALNPRFIYVGESYFTGASQLFVSPTGEGGMELRRQIQQKEMPVMTYNSFSSDIHEHLQWGWNVPLDAGACTQLREQTANSWVRYPNPGLQSSFRTLSTRQILEEMIRATIEGTKNQLWAFLLGDPRGEKRPTKDELAALQGTVAGLTGRRTGTLVWGGHLRIEVFTPVVEEALANGKWAALTEHLLHQQGISRTIVSGPSSLIPDPNPDGIDIKIFLERTISRRTAIHRYIRSLVRKIFLLSGDALLVKRARENKLPLATMGDFGIEQENAVKNKIVPLYSTGLMSPQTAMKKSGMDYETEMAQHKAADKEELTPPASFAQAVVNTKKERSTSEQNGQNGQAGKSNKAVTK